MRESNGHAYVFVGLERTGGVVIYDISNPSDAAFVNHCDQPCNKLCGQTPVRLVFFAAHTILIYPLTTIHAYAIIFSEFFSGSCNKT